MEVHAFDEMRPLATDLARRLDAPCRAVEVHRFPDLESLVRVECEGPECAVLVRSLDDANAKLLEVLFAADALRRSGVRADRRCPGAQKRSSASPVRARRRGEARRRIREIDCLEINHIARLAGSPANESAGLRLLRGVSDVVRRGEPLMEIHAQSETQLGFASEYVDLHPDVFWYGY